MAGKKRSSGKARSTTEKGTAFEREVAELFRLKGYDVTRDTLLEGRRTDVLVASIRHGFRRNPEKLVIECKDEKRPIGPGKVQDFINRVRNAREARKADGGIFVARRGLTAHARAAVKNHPYVELRTYDDLLSGLIDFGPYLKRLVYDFEHFDEYVDAKGLRKKAPMIDKTAVCDLKRFYVPLRVKAPEARPREAPPSSKLRGRVEAPESLPLREFISAWLQHPDRTHLTVLGDFGTGKSSFLLHLAYTLAKEGLTTEGSFGRVPLYIDLRDYYRMLRAESLVTSTLNDRYDVACNFALFRRMLEAGRILLLLDGFDEMVTRHAPQDTTENLRELLRLALPNTKTILTCRTPYFRTAAEAREVLTGQPENPLLAEIQDRPGFEISELTEFDESQICELLGKRLESKDDPAEARKAGEPHWKRIRQIQGLEDLAHRPFLLDMIIKTLPKLKKGAVTDIAGLYATYVDSWIKHDDWRTILTPKGKRLLMEEMAIAMSEASTEGRAPLIHFSAITERFPLRPEYVKPAVDPTVYKSYDLYDHDTRTCAFLNRDADGNYRFIHRSFQDYFAAAWFVRHLDQLSEDDQRKWAERPGDRAWREVWRFALAMSQDALRVLAAQPDMTRFDLSSLPLTDVGLAHVAKLKQLQSLELSQTGVTDAGLAHLAELKQLQSLELSHTGVTDAGLAHLAKLRQLRSLSLLRTGVTDAGLSRLANLKPLEWLSLSYTRVTDAGLAHVAKLKQLRWLDLVYTGVTDTGLAHAAELEQLQWLWLSGTRVTDAGLAHLAKLEQLQWLWLSGTGVTDVGLAHVAKLKQLERLYLRGTRVTDAGIKRLKKALPKCRILH